jgi:hypothetical protein
MKAPATMRMSPIDRQFVRNLPDDQHGVAAVAAVVDAACSTPSATTTWR